MTKHVTTLDENILKNTHAITNSVPTAEKNATAGDGTYGCMEWEKQLQSTSEWKSSNFLHRSHLKLRKGWAFSSTRCTELKCNSASHYAVDNAICQKQNLEDFSWEWDPEREYTTSQGRFDTHRQNGKKLALATRASSQEAWKTCWFSWSRSLYWRKKVTSIQRWELCVLSNKAQRYLLAHHNTKWFKIHNCVRWYL